MRLDRGDRFSALNEPVLERAFCDLNVRIIAFSLIFLKFTFGLTDLPKSLYWRAQMQQITVDSS